MSRGVSECTARANVARDVLAEARDGTQREREIEISHSNAVCYYSLGVSAGLKTAVDHSGITVK